jgi:hypothetical protein
MAKSDRLYQDAQQAIQRVFSDTSVSPRETRIALETIKEEIDILISSLPDGGESDDGGE